MNKINYANVTYRPQKNTLILECSSVLCYFSLADRAKNIDEANEFIATIEIYLFYILSFCENDIDFKEVEKFFYEVSLVGDLGKNFYDKYSGMFNSAGKEYAIKYLDEFNKKNEVDVNVKVKSK